MGKSNFRKAKDPLGSHSRVYARIVNSFAYQALGSSARVLYIELLRTLTSFNNGRITATATQLHSRGIRSKTTIAKGLRQLEAVGLLVKTMQGGIAGLSHIQSTFRFTHLPCDPRRDLGVAGVMPTHDYERFASLDHARVAVKRASLPIGRRKPKVQKVDVDGSFAGPLRSTNETCENTSNVVKVQFVNRRTDVNKIRWH